MTRKFDFKRSTIKTSLSKATELLSDKRKERLGDTYEGIMNLYFENQTVFPESGSGEIKMYFQIDIVETGIRYGLGIIS